MTGRALSLACAVALASTLFGCTPVAFRPARTVPKGDTEHSVGASAIQAGGWVPGASYSLRSGVGDGVDLGLGVATPAALSVEANFEILRSPSFDLALGPTLAMELVSRVPMVSLPLIVDLNLGSRSSIVAYGAPVLIGGREQDYGWRRAWYLQAGAGLDLRTASWLSVRPNVGILTPIDLAGAPVPIIGLGFALGDQRAF